jgi:hypothetical protein
MTLVELDQAPDPAWEVFYSGWNRASGDFSSVVAIHHPGTDEKRISFENDPTTTTSYLQNTVPGAGTHIRVIDWDEGTTEGGSSGLALVRSEPANRRTVARRVCLLLQPDLGLVRPGIGVVGRRGPRPRRA